MNIINTGRTVGKTFCVKTIEDLTDKLLRQIKGSEFRGKVQDNE